MSEELITDLQIPPLFKVDVCGSTDGCNAPAPLQKLDSALNDITYCSNVFVCCPDEGDTWMLTPSSLKASPHVSLHVSLAECGIGVLAFVE